MFPEVKALLDHLPLFLFYMKKREKGFSLYVDGF